MEKSCGLHLFLRPHLPAHSPHFLFQPHCFSFKSWTHHVPSSERSLTKLLPLLEHPSFPSLMSAQAWVQCQSTPSGKVPWDPSRGQCPIASSYRPSLSLVASLGLLWIIAFLPYYSLNSGRVGGSSLFTIIWLAPEQCTIHLLNEWVPGKKVIECHYRNDMVCVSKLHLGLMFTKPSFIITSNWHK